MKKTLCVILSVCLLTLICSVGIFGAEPAYQYEHTRQWDEDCKTSCHGQCGTSPVLIVPGIMQSQVYVQDENGNDLLTSDGFPIVEGMDMSFMFDMKAVEKEVKAKLPSIALDVVKRDKDSLIDTVVNLVDEAADSHYFNSDGTRKNDVEVDEYWYSLEVCKTMPEKSYNYAKGYEKDENGNAKPTTKYQYEYDFIKRQVDISSFCEKYGYDHTYYFAYSSFGNTLEIAKTLKEYVQMVKCQTGHDKVSLVFISLGGTIGNVYLSEYADPDELDRVVFAAAALDGSYLLADLMDANSTLDETDVIYSELVPNLLTLKAELMKYMSLGYLGNAVLRAVPETLFKSFLNDALTRGINESLGKLVRNCPSMWALVPSGAYPELSQKYISDEEHKALKEMTDKYYGIQSQAGETIKRLNEYDDITVFVVCGYDLQLPALVDHYRLSSDNIIQAASTSCGGTFADVGQTLGDDYKPALDSSYLSPDGCADAGTCALPDNTFFVKGQSHLTLQYSVNDVIELCVQLVSNKDITDARSNSGGYPQFNEYRDLRTIGDLMRKWNESDKDSVSQDKREAIENACTKAEEIAAKKVWSASEAKEVEEELAKAMSKAKLTSDSYAKTVFMYDYLPYFEKALKFVSDILARIFGAKDYWIFTR